MARFYFTNKLLSSIYDVTTGPRYFFETVGLATVIIFNITLYLYTMYKSDEIYKYLIALLISKGIKHDIYTFPSGAIIVDIWHNDDFYVIQIENDFTGFSKIDDDNPGIFDTIPDRKFFNLDEVKGMLDELI